VFGRLKQLGRGGWIRLKKGDEKNKAIKVLRPENGKSFTEFGDNKRIFGLTWSKKMVGRKKTRLRSKYVQGRAAKRF